MLDNIRIAAIDDHPMFLEGLERAFMRTAKLEIVAKGGSAADACRIARDMRPDILLLDVGIPGGGAAAAREIAMTAPEVKIIMLTGSDDDEHVADALEAGAMGYVMKGAGSAELLEAIRAVQSGEAYVTPSVAIRLLVQKMRPARPGAAPQDAMTVALSFREQQILDCAGLGLTNKEIAGKLGLSALTVRNYMSQVLAKLKVRNRREAINVASARESHG